ncbi:hypothetical protein RK21_04341 [Pseudomonas plecoglossicida]|nr:hypothetical protein RK21_04341 [Pseudomonas plecoglossicida]
MVGVGSGESIACAGLFAAKAAPTGTAQFAKAVIIPVGAALAAKGPVQLQMTQT